MPLLGFVQICWVGRSSVDAGNHCRVSQKPRIFSANMRHVLSYHMGLHMGVHFSLVTVAAICSLA